MTTSPFSIARGRRLGFAVYCAAVVSLVAYVPTVEWGSGTGWVVARCAVAGLLVMAPFFPWVGLAVYVFLAYGTPRYERELEVLISSHLLDAVALLALCALFVRRRGLNEVLLGLRAPLAMLMLALALWVLIAAAVAWLAGLPWQPYPRHTPVLFAHALAIFLVAQHALGTSGASWRFALAACASLSVRALTQGSEGVYLEGDIAPLIVMAIPLVIIGIAVARALPLRAVFALLGVYLGFTLLVTYNRAAAVAAVALVVAAVWQARRHRLAFGVVLVTLTVAAIVLAPQGYRDRFRALWDSGASHSTARLDRATAGERIQLWKAGWAMAEAHPLTGVGPGNFPHFVGRYAPGKQGLAAHSNYVHALAETGFPGLLLYVLFFLSSLLVLRRVQGSSPDRDQRIVAAMLELSLIAYLVAGVFISRHDLVLAYLLAGWAAALSARPWIAAPLRTRSDDSNSGPARIPERPAELTGDR